MCKDQVSDSRANGSEDRRVASGYVMRASEGTVYCEELVVKRWVVVSSYVSRKRGG